MWRGVFAVAVAILILGNAQNNGANGDTQRQQAHAGGASTRGNPPRPPAASEGARCPGENQSNMDCNTLSAVANVRQADAAERFNNLALFEIAVGIATAIAAICAAFFAASAANAASASYRAFVAAEDAILFVEFPNGGELKISVDGAQQPSVYFLHIRITNIGKSTAQVHSCWVPGGSALPINHTFKKDHSATLNDHLEIKSLSIFELRVSYTTPIRPNAELILKVFPRMQTNIHGVGRVVANIVTSRIDEMGKRKWQFWRSKG